MSNRSLLLFDFDGPILDVRLKYHRVYSTILEENGYKPLAIDAYWDFKRNKIPDLDILFRSRAEGFLEKYWALREEKIETIPYLDLDSLQNQVSAVFERLTENYDVVLVTMRASEAGVRYQLRKSGLEKFFKEVLCSGANPDLHRANRSKWEIKHAMISKFLIRENRHPRSIRAMIGDTETDVRCGQAIGCMSVAVDCGIRTSELLAKECPDAIIPDLGSLESLL